MESECDHCIKTYSSVNHSRYIARFSYHKQTLWLQSGCFLIFHQIQLEMFLKCFLNLKTSNDNNNPDQAIVMQEKGRSSFVKYAMDVHNISLLV